MKKICIAVIAVLAFCATAYGVVLWNTHAAARRTVDAKAFIEIFQYIAAHEGEEFDYVAVAKALTLSEDALVSYLFALERAGKIKVSPRYLARKPIVVSSNDRKWYFHRVTLPHTEVPEPPAGPPVR